MDDRQKESLWKQFGGSIDMLKNAILQCPGDYGHRNRRFFYVTYHCLVFLDYYLTIPPGTFAAPLPYTIRSQGEIPAEAVDDIVPERIYTKEELLEYVEWSRNKCRQLIAGLTDEKLNGRWIETPDELAPPGTMQYSVLEILLYNLRHVQHHTAQLNLLLRQAGYQAPRWVLQAKDDL